MRFSERYGYKTVREIIQFESIDNELKTGLWNVLNKCVWDVVRPITPHFQLFRLSDINNKEMRDLCKSIWSDFFIIPVDTLYDDWTMVISEIRKNFFECPWYAVYDFIEFIGKHLWDSPTKDYFLQSCNHVLEKEMSGYRFVDDEIVSITDQSEIEEIEQAIDSKNGSVQSHIRRALELLSDRESPDYRNSIKESISSLECLVQQVLGEKGTLGQLLKKLKNEIGLHPALKNAISHLYGYTSDEGGIRHALMESDKIKFEDAKFFLVVCSAFINFVESKMVQIETAKN